MENIKLIIAWIIAAIAQVSYAQEASTTAARDTARTETRSEDDGQDKDKRPGITLSGYIDSYVLYAFNNPKSGTLLGNPAVYNGSATGRAFDRFTNQFSLGLVQTKVTYSNAKSDLVIDLTFGPNAELGNFGNTRSTTLWVSPNNYQSQLLGTSAAIKQAYFTYKATQRLSLTVGQFGTHIGYEVIDAPLNFNYSLSNLFNNGPFYHIGVKASYDVAEKISVMAGLVNNWDNLFDNNSQKSVIAQAHSNAMEGLHVYLNYIGGYGDDTYLSTQASASGKAYLENYTRQLFDLSAGHQVNEQFYMGLNAAYGIYHFRATAGDAVAIAATYGSASPAWNGVALYANYAVNDCISIGGRYEYFNDEHHVRYLGTKNTSLTVTTPLSLADDHFLVKPEIRIDVAARTKNGDLKYYEDRSGSGTNSQKTIGVAFIYKY